MENSLSMEDRINYDKKQIIKGLQNLGFTLNDSKVYFSLLTLGKSNPAKISEISGVDRPRVYDSLKRLKAKKFIEEEPTKRAPKYKAKPPKYVFNYLRSDYNQKISLTKDLERKLDNYKVPIVEPSVWSITGQTNINRAIDRLITKANKRISILLTPDISGHIKTRFYKLVQSLVNRKKKNILLDIEIAFAVTERHEKLIQNMFQENLVVYSWSSGTIPPFGLFLSENSFILTISVEMKPMPIFGFGITMENATPEIMVGFHNLIQYNFSQLCKKQVWFDKTSLL